MKRFLQSPLMILTAIALGLLCGFSGSSIVMQGASLISEVFINLLKLISLPIIFLAIASTITGMQDFKEMRFLGKKVFSYTLLTTILAATIALLFFVFINPAEGAVDAKEVDISSQPGYLTFLTKIIPSNLVAAFLENNVIGIAFVAILFSVSVLFIPQEQKKTLHNLFSSLFAAVLKMTSFIASLMPVGILAFTTLLVRDLQGDFQEMESLAWFLATVTLANLFQGLVVLPLFLKYKGLSPLKVGKGMLPALVLAFFSKSSNATLPLAMRCAEENLGVSRKVANFSLPLCSVINMNACAGFILTSVLFVSMMNGMSFSYVEMAGWVILATIAAIGNAGVPMGCYFLASAFLISLHVPLHIMGLILPFYALLDMIETAINVWSDACVTVAVAQDVKEVAIDIA